jgi:hypothetical protein
MVRTLPDFEKLKFLQVDPGFGENNSYKAVYHYSHEEYPRARNPEPISKKKKQNKISFEPEILEKFPIAQTASEKMKIVAFNPTFDRIIRHNIIEAINKQFKLEEPNEKEFVKTELEEYINSKENEIFTKTAEALGVDLFNFKVDFANDINDDKNDIVNTDNMDNM